MSEERGVQQVLARDVRGVDARDGAAVTTGEVVPQLFPNHFLVLQIYRPFLT